MALKYPGLRSYIAKRSNQGISKRKIYKEAVKKFGYDTSFRNFGRYFSKVEKSKPQPQPITKDPSIKQTKSEKFIDILREKTSIMIVKLCDELNCTPKKVYSFIKEYRQLGYEIIFDDLRVYLGTHEVADVEKFSISKEKEIIFGVASDLHFGSTSCQITRLNEFCEECRKSGVKHIFVPGDITAGSGVYAGQENDQYAKGSDEMEESLIVNLPTGFTWLMLGGNHDYSFIRRINHNPLRTIQNKRNDCVYVGFDDANVEIMKGVDLKMWHPMGAPAYALSYKIQKRMDRLGIDELNKLVRDSLTSTVRILLVGHFHSNLSTLMGGILGLQCGAFEGRTNLTERMGVTPTIGGWIIRMWFNKSNILEYEQKFWTRPEIENDWKHYKHTLEEPKKIIEPIFK